jgi:hypothetical protein
MRDGTYNSTPELRMTMGWSFLIGSLGKAYEFWYKEPIKILKRVSRDGGKNAENYGHLIVLGLKRFSIRR